MMMHKEGRADLWAQEQSAKLRKHSYPLLLLASCLVPNVALAQSFPGDGEGGTPNDMSPPPEKLSVTDTGVDIRTGRFAYSKTDLSGGGLELVRQIANNARGHLQPFSNMSHNWDIFIAERRFDKSKNLPPASAGEGAGNDFQLFVHYGGSKQVFEAYQSSTGTGHESSASGLLTVSGSRGSASALYTYQGFDGVVVEFRQIGSGDCSTVYRCAYVSKVTNPDGGTLDFMYETGGPSGHTSRLAEVRSNRGMAIRFEYGGAGTASQVSKACLFNLTNGTSTTSCTSPDALQTVSYGYAGKLTSVTDANGDVWQYDHSGGMKFYYPGESTPYLTNTLQTNMTDQLEEHEIVTQQLRGDGYSVSYQYNYALYQDSGTSTSYPYYPSLAGGVMTDSEGRATNIAYSFPIVPGTWQGTYPAGSPINFGGVNYQTSTGPTSVTDPIGRTWEMDYCDPVAMAGYPPSENHRCLVTPVLQSMTDPEGIVTEYKYDGMRTRNTIETRIKAKPGSGLADIVTSATYSCANLAFCKKPLTTTDADGNVTDYTYDSVHGGILTKTLPADASGVRAQTRYSYVQRNARDASGAALQPPVWVLASEEYCRTTAASGSGCAGGAGDEVVTTYDYGPPTGPNNLWLRGVAVTADGQTLRTCYQYDDLGRKIAETQPAANLQSCS